jgi:hypothetical protein
MVPGVNREPRKKTAPNPEVLLLLLYRWRDEAIKAGKEITRIAVAYETGRDGFWLAATAAATVVVPQNVSRINKGLENVVANMGSGNRSGMSIR